MADMDTPGETPRDIAASVCKTITEIDNAFTSFSKAFDDDFRNQRDILLSTIRRADRKGADFTLANAKKELIKLNKFYIRKRRAKFNTILQMTCKKNGRNVEHIVKIAGYNYRTKNVKQ